jgi:RNA polymerase sigma-70 factor (ECF subfamily)
MVAAMTFSGGALSVVVDHVAGVGSGRDARACSARWAHTQPVLAGLGSPAAAAGACRAARGADQDVLVSALLAVAAGDEWAQLTILAGLADRLASVVSGWARGGMPAAVLADAEAELVGACWAAIADFAGGPPPGRPGLVLVDRARETVRAGRRRQRRLEDRLVPWPVADPAAAAGPGPALEVLAGAITDAVAAGRLSVPAARAVYLTRVAGLPTAEAAELLGCGSGVLRAVRSRAERRLAA